MITTERIPSKAHKPADEAAVATVKEQTAPTLQDVMCVIRLDATKDALTYLMRSNTGHDGE